MRRREFVTLLGGAAVTLRSVQSYAQPQPSKIYRMGYLAAARVPHLIEALQEGLRKFGYIEDQNLKVEYRFAQGGTATLDVLAAALVRLSPDVIVIVGTPAVIAVASDQDDPYRHGESQRARRAIIGRARPLLAIKAKSASPIIPAVISSNLNCPSLEKTKSREAKSRGARLNNALLEMMIFNLCQLKLPMNIVAMTANECCSSSSQPE